MAKNISNRFYVTALEDGTTLHGNLVANKSLTQSWNGTAAIPDWSVAANQPTIYLTLMSGNSVVIPSNTFTWLYNGNVINFSGDTSTDGKFQKTTYPLVYAGQTYNMPALKIIANLASSENVDIDTITFMGEYVIGGQPLEFSAMTQIRISTIQAGSNLGVVNFVDGISDITADGQVITMYAQFYGADGAPILSGWSTQWYLNDASSGTAGADKTVQTASGQQTFHNAYQVSEDDVVDHATVRCDFIVGGNVKFSSYVGIDDMQDPEYMYIQYEGNNGNAASLRNGDSAHFQIWVGTRDDAGVVGGAETPTYNHIKVKLLDGSGIPIGGKDDTSGQSRNGSLADNIPATEGGATGDGWRDFTNLMSGGKAPVNVNYTTVSTYGKNLTGIVLAYTD